MTDTLIDCIECGGKCTHNIDGNYIHCHKCGKDFSLLDLWNARVLRINTSVSKSGGNLAASNLIPMWGEPCRGFYCGCDGCKAYLAQTKALVMEGAGNCSAVGSSAAEVKVPEATPSTNISEEFKS